MNSLKEGRWFKLICGASYQHLPAIRNLALVYALAGADCVDVAADPAVVIAVKEAFQVVSQSKCYFASAQAVLSSEAVELPLLMISISDGEDPHFRKAVFDPAACPADCPRPCEAICPAAAITFEAPNSGVVEERCYGCGRCLPICPVQQIEAVTRATALDEIAPQLLDTVDAVEIHTQVGRYDAFMEVWSRLRPYLAKLQLVSISCLDQDHVVDYLWQLYEGIQPLKIPLIWQTDGRSMSGDIGKGTTHATIRFAQKVLQAGPPGFVQLAGGTNSHTVSKVATLAPHSSSNPSSEDLVLRSHTGIAQPAFGGIAYGSFARHLMAPFLEGTRSPSQGVASISADHTPITHPHGLDHLETCPTRLGQAVQTAHSLIAPLKAAQSIRSIATSPRHQSPSNPLTLNSCPPYPPLFK
ncbi:MAG: LdpA C-terminal domain-containing domain [Cyanobacteria bacterium P01_H01_bin.58]